MQLGTTRLYKRTLSRRLGHGGNWCRNLPVLSTGRQIVVEVLGESLPWELDLKLLRNTPGGSQ